MSDAHSFHAHLRVDILITEGIIVFESQPFNHQVEAGSRNIAMTAKISFDQGYNISMWPQKTAECAPADLVDNALKMEGKH